MKIIKNILLTSIFILVLFDIALPQADNFINQYDPYIITLKKMSYYTEEDPFTSYSPFAIFISGTIGSQTDAFMKVITADKIGFGVSKDFQDGIIQEISFLDFKGILIPPIKDMNGSNFLELKIQLYTGFSEIDYAKLKKTSETGNVTVNSSLINPFSSMYNFYGSKNDVYKPTDENWAEVQVFLAGMGTRQKIDVGTINYVVPFTTSVTNIKSGDNFIQGDKIIEDKKTNAMAIVNFKQINNELIVSAQDYYKKVIEKFMRLAGNGIYADDLPGIMEELNDMKSIGFKDKNDIYISPEAKKQIEYVVDLLMLAQPIKADTLKETPGRIPLEGELVLDYFRANITGDKNRTNRYIYDDIIGNDMNRIKLQRELELIRNYYNLK